MDPNLICNPGAGRRRRGARALGGLLYAVSAGLLCAAPASAAPTTVVVRVISQDAKFVGDSMGGAAVTLSDARTGARLGEGVTQGGTGDTERIMAAQGRAPLRATPTAAAFRTTLDIDRPTLVRVEVRGPLNYPDSAQRAATERWLLPGQSAEDGDGWVIELPGLAISLTDAPPAPSVRGRPQSLTAHVQLMCGCPITPGGLWDAADYDVTLTVGQDGQPDRIVPMRFVAAPGRYRAEWVPATTGAAELTIVARNRRTGNTGVLTRTVQVQ